MTAPLIGITATKRTLDLPFVTVDAHTVFTAYVEAIAAAGGAPVLLPVLPDGPIPAVDGLVLTGGADLGTDPERDRFELDLVAAAITARTPMLGVCRGLQVLNVACGGTLLPHVDGHVDVRHPVAVTPGTTLAAVVGESVAATSLHHQAVDRLGDRLRVSGAAPDGTIEAVEAACGAPVVGVQWHPELEADDRLWRWLVEASS